MAQITIPEMYTDQIQDVGSVRRVYFHFLAQFLDGTKRWYYFGTLPTDPGKAPTTADPVTTTTYVSFPADFSFLPQEANDVLYDLALRVGKKKQVLE